MMGTDYTLGIVKEFTATASQMGPTEWEELLNQRLDIEQYNLKFEDGKAIGTLKEEVFEEDIEDLYRKLVAITDNGHMLNWLNNGGTDINRYDTWVTEMKFKRKSGSFTLCAKLSVLFVEGKVLVEEFNTEPKLMNWLFRHADLSNRLAGCIMSDIIG